VVSRDRHAARLPRVNDSVIPAQAGIQTTFELTRCVIYEEAMAAVRIPDFCVAFSDGLSHNRAVGTSDMMLRSNQAELPAEQTATQAGSLFKKTGFAFLAGSDM
jgi:hypothetical protein